MGDTTEERVLQHMRERSMPDVVHQDGGLYGLRLRLKDEDALLLERYDSLAHQVEGA